MNLDETQKQTVQKWIEDGLKLSEIQDKLASELGLRLTYMEVRFLLDDLKLKPKEKEPSVPAASALLEKGAEKAPSAAASNASEESRASPEEESRGAPGDVSVTVDQVARPGALVSGQATFSDGHAAEWQLDQFGRLGLASRPQGYRPSQEDLMAFQAELQNVLAKLGF